MKKTFITLSLAILSTSAIGASCPKPNEYALTAFKLIEDKKVQELEAYLRDHTVAKNAINEQCEDMYMATLRRRNEGARQLLERIGYGPKFSHDINGVIFGMNSYFDYAAAFSPVSVIQELAERGGKSEHLLTTVAARNTIDVIDWALAQRKTSVDAIFHFAVATNTKSVIEQLIRRGANLTSYGFNAALERVKKNPSDRDILELLVLSGYTVQSEAMSAAVATSSIEALTYLTNSGGVLTEKQMEVALRNGRLDMVQHLRSLGIGFPKSALKDAVASKSTKLLSYVLGLGVDLFQLDGAGNNAFYYVTSLEMAKFLRSKGLNIDHKNSQGLSALHESIPVFNENVSTNLEVLLQAGANPNLPDARGNFPIHMAFVLRTKCDNPTARVKVLIEGGAHIDQRDAAGYTPLMRAAMRASCNDYDWSSSEKDPKVFSNKLITYLVEKGADVELTIGRGRGKISAATLYEKHNNTDYKVRDLLKF